MFYLQTLREEFKSLNMKNGNKTLIRFSRVLVILNLLRKMKKAWVLV